MELPRGELVGKTIFRGNEDDEDDEEYKNSAVSLEDGEETNLTGKSIINEYVFKSTPDFWLSFLNSHGYIYHKQLTV